MYKSDDTIAIVNNALTTTVTNGSPIRIVDDLTNTESTIPLPRNPTQLRGTQKYSGAQNRRGFVKDCTITALLDSMGSFGSCATGPKDATFNPANLDILITSGLADSMADFSFAMKLNYDSSNGKTTLVYTIAYKSFVLASVQINVIIKNGLCQVLSANNTFEQALTYIEQISCQTPEQVLNFGTMLDNDTHISEIMRILSRKFMGDFGQELNVIVANCGQYDPKTCGGKQHVLADGDRPSFTRAGYLLFNALNGINTDSGILYIMNRGGIIIKKDGYFGEKSGTPTGGKMKKKKKIKIKKKRKITKKRHKTKKKHNKKRSAGRKRVKKMTKKPKRNR